jgi:ATP-dependent helicase/nuclease subunit B
MVQVVSRAAAVARAPAARTESAVALLDVMDARALRFERVYLLGLNEKAFPRLVQERCFIDEADREAWAGDGVVLDRRSDLIGREMLLMYLAASRPDAALTVSYLTADAAGRGSAPSVFVDELTSAWRRAGRGVEHKTIGPGRFVPPVGELACASDAANAAVLAAFDGSARTIGDLGAGAGELLAAARAWAPDAIEGCSFGILAAHRRWRADVPDAFDGRIDDAVLLEALAERIPDRWVFSASELNSYARCPWQFLARYLLDLRPLAAPEMQMTPADRGSFCHDVLWRTCTLLRDRFGAPVNLARIPAEDVDRALDEAVEAERLRLDEAAVHSRLWEVQTRFWRGLLGAYLADQRQRADGEDGDSGAVHFELGFGMSGAAAERTDPHSRGDPVTVRAGETAIRVRGKIDRVDREGALLAVDYKTGALPTYVSIREGLDLQLALYARMLEAALGEPVHGGAYHDVRNHAHRYFAGFRYVRGRRVEVEEFPEQLDASMQAVARCVRGIRAGRFDALPTHGCLSWCPYRQICHYSRHRARRKAEALAAESGGADDG